MRKNILAIASLIFLATLCSSFSPAIKNKNMQELKTEVTIKAPIETVWHQLTDFAAYPTWNPFIVQIEGELALNNKFKTTMINGGKENHFTPKITLLEEGKKFEWLGSIPLRLFTGNHYFHLEKIDDNTTHLLHGERFGGLLSNMIMNKIGENTLEGFQAMNQALKTRCEAL